MSLSFKTDKIEIMNESKKGYIVQADVLRIIAIFGTLAIHYLYPIYSRPDFLGGMAWWVTNILNAVARPSIPIFIMLSGALLIPKEESVTNNLLRTLKRLILPFFIWALIYFAWDIFFLGYHRNSYDLVAMFYTGSVYHLYFLVILAALYFLLPFIRLILKKGSDEISKYLVELAFGVGIMMYLVQYLVIPSHPLFSSYTLWISYLGYFLTGYLLRKPTPKQLTLYRWLFLGSLLITLVLNYFNLFLFSNGTTLLMKDGISYFDQYLSPNVIVMSVSLYQLVMYSETLKRKITDSRWATFLTKELARATFAVYIIHFIVLNVLDSYGFSFERFPSNLFVFIFVKGIVLFVASFGIASLLIRIPIIKLSLGERK